MRFWILVMKKSGKVGLVLLSALGLASCSGPAHPPPAVIANPQSQATMTWDGTPRDPCAQQYFDERLCQNAINGHGYHYGGTWIPMMYSRPYGSYYSSHSSYISSGGSYSPTPVEVYNSGFKAPSAGTVVRGGFGTTATALGKAGS
jgi:hypothetical protein